MGRGRQKAKQTKVARELKYYSPETDYDALRRELGGGPQSEVPREVPREVPLEDDTGQDERDEYADWASDGSR